MGPTTRFLAKFKAMHANGGEVPTEFQTKKFAQRVLPAKWGKEGPTITATSLADDYVAFPMVADLCDFGVPQSR